MLCLRLKLKYKILTLRKVSNFTKAGHTREDVLSYIELYTFNIINSSKSDLNSNFELNAEIERSATVTHKFQEMRTFLKGYFLSEII